MLLAVGTDNLLEIVTKQRGGGFFANTGAAFNWTNSASPLFAGRNAGRHKYVVIRKIFATRSP